MTQIVYTCSTDGVKAACAAINSGGVIIFPTDTVYGIGCSPFKNKAINRVYKIKGRDTAKQLPVLANSYDDLAKFCQFDFDFGDTKNWTYRQWVEDWPGPVTMVVKLLGHTGQRHMDTVAVGPIRGIGLDGGNLRDCGTESCWSIDAKADGCSSGALFYQRAVAPTSNCAH